MTTPLPMISLKEVQKVYPGSSDPAVAKLSLDISKGEILVLVGPSGCGKSTTLRLINRMIEPTSGRILFDGEDVTDVNGDMLRRRIGYVIQKVGLFPHKTIAENVATVPRLLGWEKSKIAARVDELLALTGLEPKQFRDRYPKELSGGQAQRVGVARALGADPPVMLMDEPFGAIDPITRNHLQNEFLRLQSDLQKTIVFVTHDIDEAIKMGDRIAILGEQSAIHQLDSPERILANPSDDFVDDFIGAGSTLKGLNYERVRSVNPLDYPVVQHDVTRAKALQVLSDSGLQYLLVLDASKKPSRWVTESQLNRSDMPLIELGRPVTAIISSNATLRDTLEAMLESSAGNCCVVDKNNEFTGVVGIETLVEAIKEMKASADRHNEKTRSS